MKVLLSILSYFLICQTLLYSGELEERRKITEHAEELFKKGDYKTLSDMAKRYLETKARASSGRWKLRFIYLGINRSIDTQVKDKYKNSWDDLEKELLLWTKTQSQDPISHISYAIFLINKAWMHRGNNYARRIPKENLEKFRAEVDKAIKYLMEHKDIASQDPHWYAVMLNLSKLDSWNRIYFYALVNEALSKFPHYYAIYEFSLYRMHPKWSDFSKEEIEKIAQKILKVTNDKNGAYARFYWMAKDIIYHNKLITNSDIDWNTMSKSMEKLIGSYPTQNNINGLAYLSCLSNKQKTSRKFINKIVGSPILGIWETQENFDICNNISKNYQETTITTITPDKLLDYIENHKSDRPLFIYFSSYIKGDILKDVNKIEKLAKGYKNKIDFLSVNFYPHKISAYPNLYTKFYLKKIPSSVMLYKKKIILRFDEDPSLEQFMSNILKRNIDAILKEMKYTNFLKYFKESIIDESSFLNTEANIRSNIQDYLSHSSKYKALAVASSIRKDTWVSGRALFSKSQDKANAEAIRDCKEDKKKYNNTEECTLFMIGNKYVFEKNNSFIVKQKPIIVKQKPIQYTKNIDLARYKYSSPSSLKNIKQKYQKSKSHKAWAITVDNRYRLYNALSTGQVSQEKADKEALKLCNLKKVTYEKFGDAFGECILFKEGDENVSQNNISYKQFNDTNISNIFTTISPNKVKEYIQNNSMEKPIFIYFQREHTNLAVDQQILSIAQKYKDKIDFILISTDPKALDKDLKAFFHLRRTPHIAVIYKKNIVMKYDRSDFSDYKIRNINKQLKLLLTESKQKDYFEKYGEGIYGNLYHTFNADLTTKINTTRYLGLKGYKAWAVAIDKRDSIGNWSIKQSSQEEAKNKALKGCETAKQKRRITTECVLYMIGDKYVYTH